MGITTRNGVDFGRTSAQASRRKNRPFLKRMKGVSDACSELDQERAARAGKIKQRKKYGPKKLSLRHIDRRLHRVFEFPPPIVRNEFAASIDDIRAVSLDRESLALHSA